MTHKRCTRCGYFINDTQTLGGCYCGAAPNRMFNNLHDVLSFQAMGVAFTQSTVGPELLYTDGFPGASKDQARLTLKEWITKFNNKGRQIRVKYINGTVKTLSVEKFMNILLKDGHVTDDEAISS